MPIKYLPGTAAGYQNALLKTGQTTIYHTGDDADAGKGSTLPSYTVMTTGSQSGTTNIYSSHYAAATIAFVSATKKITDSANLLASVKTGDTIKISGSASNDGSYTVATGNVAGEIVTTQALVDESAGAYITIQKLASPSNNVVFDELSGLYWRRYTTSGEKIGTTSAGTIIIYDATLCFTLHPADGNLSIDSTTKKLKIAGGAGEVTRYFAGQFLELSGFANAGNNRAGGYGVVSVTVNGSDLDIVLWTGFSSTNPLTTESAAGSRAIKLVCRTAYEYIYKCNLASLGGYSDWRLPNYRELFSLYQIVGAANSMNTTAFVSWPVSALLTSTTMPSTTANMEYAVISSAGLSNAAKTAVAAIALVRG